MVSVCRGASYLHSELTADAPLILACDPDSALKWNILLLLQRS